MGWLAGRRRSCTNQGNSTPPRNETATRQVAVPGTEEREVARVHAVLQELLERWAATKPGETLELEFIAAFERAMVTRPVNPLRRVAFCF